MIILDSDMAMGISVVQDAHIGSGLPLARHAAVAAKPTISKQFARPHIERGKVRGCQVLAKQ